MNNKPKCSCCPSECKNQSRQRSSAWKKGLAVGGYTVAIVGAAVFTTLALTHKSAVTENAIAYLRGYTDGLNDGVLDCLIAFCSDSF